MATYTRAQFIKSVLLELQAIDPDETVEAADYERTNERCQQKLEELYDDNLVPFNLDGVIPARYMIPLTYLCAMDCTALYPVGSRLQEMLVKAENGMARLYKLREDFYAGQITPAVFF